MPEITTDELDALIVNTLLDDSAQEEFYDEFDIGEIDAVDENNASDEELAQFPAIDAEWDETTKKVYFENNEQSPSNAILKDFRSKKLKLSSDLNDYFFPLVSPTSTSTALSPQHSVISSSSKSFFFSKPKHPSRISPRLIKQNNQNSLNNTSCIFSHNSNNKKRKRTRDSVLAKSLQI